MLVHFYFKFLLRIAARCDANLPPFHMRSRSRGSCVMPASAVTTFSAFWCIVSHGRTSGVSLLRCFAVRIHNSCQPLQTCVHRGIHSTERGSTMRRTPKLKVQSKRHNTARMQDPTRTWHAHVTLRAHDELMRRHHVMLQLRSTPPKVSLGSIGPIHMRAEKEFRSRRLHGASGKGFKLASSHHGFATRNEPT